MSGAAFGAVLTIAAIAGVWLAYGAGMGDGKIR